MITIKKEVFDFLRLLKSNNTREWFEENRPLYEIAKSNIDEFAAFLIHQISKFDPSVPADTRVSKCVLRIYRDVRFSKDKTPYKNNFAIIISENRMKEGPVYFIHVEPDNNYIGGGYWRPSAQPLNAIRQEIDYNTSEFLSILTEKHFYNYFGDLSREDMLKVNPKGYEKDHPHIEFLKLKSFICVKHFDDNSWTTKAGIENLLEGLKLITPLNHFLNRALE
ncbi:Conserved hypothetical protein CHP02453 [Pseudopedobacter saltans DSM 12145]|uniref:TIGR02453 family protein n=1 Tax=Pseudopedobacter saltans (strain ATCC 51119 / DSM 12145 / JCM 21818 / CCUG 39354 / LMG 10337 / NBRC 100064 / NCIMB 13643) TaxID=762903 RepID=F0S5I9_PSESL|nr:DUF2461 domain-containing protein [Pseudopedobacter saltans]ADY53153.1 Conserved hypothetical protein CHP02453 [Pseudopedobacter saltans DSM 12145]